ncbi:MAG: hypothetical protein ACLFSE_06850 [Spirochaetia bacterium]
MIFRNLAPDDYILLEIDGKHIAMTGRAPLPGEEFELILYKRGAIIDKRVTSGSDYLVYPSSGARTEKVIKAEETGTRIITYDELFSLPAYHNMVEKKQNEFYKAVRESTEKDKQIILQLLAGDYADQSTEKLRYILDNHPPEKKEGTPCAFAAVRNKAGSSVVQNTIRNLELLSEYGFNFAGTAGLTATPLHAACDEYDYSLELVETLLRIGLNPDNSDDRNRTPLSIAAGTRDRDFYKVKDSFNKNIDFIVDWNEPGVEKYRYCRYDSDRNRIKDHSYQKAFDLVKLIVESGKAELDFEKQETSGLQSPLMQAAWTGNWQIIDYLLDVAKPNTLSGHTTGRNDPFPCWMVRCNPEEFNLRVFKKAFEKGVHPEQCDNYGRNILFYLIWRGRNCNPEAIAYLIGRGGNPFREDVNDESCARELATWDKARRDQLSLRPITERIRSGRYLNERGRGNGKQCIPVYRT